MARITYAGDKAGFPNPVTYNVTGSEKTAHFAKDFKIEVLVLKGRVALKQ